MKASGYIAHMPSCTRIAASRRLLSVVLLAVLALTTARSSLAQSMLLPMDDSQRNHLKAYGVTYQALKNGQ